MRAQGDERAVVRLVMASIKEQKKMAREIRQAFQGKPARVRRVRVKTADDLLFEEMMADYKVNGAAHLASAKKKMGQ